jgi:hypothetical protein
MAARCVGAVYRLGTNPIVDKGVRRLLKRLRGTVAIFYLFIQ